MHRTGSRIVSAPVTSPAEPAPQPAPGDDTDHSPGPKRGHRTWPERLTIATTFLAAALCFVVAAALVGGYLIARQRNVVDLEDPSQRAVAQVAAGAAPIVVLAGGDETTTPATTTAGVTTTAGAATTSTATGGAGAAATAAGGECRRHRAGRRPRARRRPRPPPPSPTPRPLRRRRSHRSTRRRRTSSSPAPTTGHASIPTPRTPAPSATARTWASAATRSWSCASTRRAERVAILSFPRDLYVEIADTGNKSRINSAYERDDPQKLVDTIYANFGIAIDHYIQVDFCAFKTLVDAVGGVSVPFEYPTRDTHTGLNVPQAGCYAFDGEAALAYVRSRYYEYEDPPGSGDWHSDGTSDRGRISRQQDFLRRVLSSILDKGPLNPTVARGLIRAATEDVVTDRDLTPAKMMEFAGVMNDVDPNSIVTYQIEATGRNINGASVLIPTIDGDNMQAVLSLFTGQTSLADMPEQVLGDTTTAAPRGATTTIANATAASDESAPSELGDGRARRHRARRRRPMPEATSAGDSATVTSLPAGTPQQDPFGITPPRDVTC